jgi:hypothetical protein
LMELLRYQEYFANTIERVLYHEEELFRNDQDYPKCSMDRSCQIRLCLLMS